MPWTAADAKSHVKGLTPKEARQWSHVANAALAACLKKGGSQSECEGSAIRQANSVVSKSHDSIPDTHLLRADIAKSDDSQQRIFGWVSIAVRKDGETLIDLQGDVIDIGDLEEAWYAYVVESSELNYLHVGKTRGYLIESMVFTPDKIAALGLAPDAVPLGVWGGFHIPDRHDYDILKTQGYFMYSIEGEAYREELA